VSENLPLGWLFYLLCKTFFCFGFYSDFIFFLLILFYFSSLVHEPLAAFLTIENFL